jgi:hypothetical protein
LQRHSLLEHHAVQQSLFRLHRLSWADPLPQGP